MVLSASPKAFFCKEKISKSLADGLCLFDVGFQFFRHDEELLNLFGFRRFKRPLFPRKNREKEKSTCFHKCLVEHRGVSSCASTALGQGGSDSPQGCHSLPGRFSSPMLCTHKRKDTPCELNPDD